VQTKLTDFVVAEVHPARATGRPFPAFLGKTQNAICTAVPFAAAFDPVSVADADAQLEHFGDRSCNGPALLLSKCGEA
jgi:hypothetical protein